MLDRSVNVPSTKLITLVIALSLFSSSRLLAQATPKIGCANTDYILSRLPDLKQVESELKSLESQLRNQIDGRITQLQKDYEDFLKVEPTLTPAARAMKQREFETAQRNLEKMKQEAQTTLENKHNQLMTPLYAKVGQAIDEVAKENGYTCILVKELSDVKIVLYVDPQVDITDLVLKKLGITSSNTAPAK